MPNRWRFAAVAVALLAAGALPSALASGAAAAQLFVALSVLSFVIGFVLNFVEGWLFSSGPSTIRPVHVAGALLLSLLAAATVALLVRPSGEPASWSTRFADRFGDLSSATLLLRLAGAGALYLGVQGVVGMAVWPFVRRWYEDPAAGLNLRIPKPRVMLPFQLARGWIVLRNGSGA